MEDLKLTTPDRETKIRHYIEEIRKLVAIANDHNKTAAPLDKSNPYKVDEHGVSHLRESALKTPKSKAVKLTDIKLLERGDMPIVLDAWERYCRNQI